MDFVAVVDQVMALLRQRGRVAYRTLQRQFQLDDEALADLKIELIDAQRLARDEQGSVLVWLGEPGSPLAPPATPEAAGAQTPLASAASAMPEAERRQLTVLFCDLVDSTALSSQLDPEDLREVVRAYQDTCATVIARFEGHIAQYLGDGLLVYFGYPLAHEDDAQRAVQTGLGITATIGVLNTRLAQEQGVRLAVRIGIHTGLVVVGTMGGRGRQEQLALGETPNIAARLQGLAAPDTVVVSATTAQLIHGYFVCQLLGAQQLRGLAQPLQVSRVLHASGAKTRLDVATPRGLTPLVGRDEEVTLLHRRWEQATAGLGQVVLLSGEAGIGKSRLVQVLHEHVAHKPHTRIEWRGSSYHQQSALYPVIDHLYRLVQWHPDVPPAETLHRLEGTLTASGVARSDTVPLLAALLSLPVPASYPPLALTAHQQRQHTLDLLLAWLHAETQRQPLLVTVEDLHWVDPSTLELISLLIDQSAQTRLYLVLTTRPEFHPSWTMVAHLTSLTLRRLAPAQVERVATHVAGNKALPAAMLQEVVRKTDGVPLYIEELTKTVLESGLLQEQEDGYALPGPLPPLAIPATLHDALMARLDRLAAVKVVAQLGAAIGRTFPYALIQAVAQLDAAMLQGALTQLVEAEVVVQRGLPPQATYTFKHALMQDAAYQSLLRRTRQQYHQQIAQAVETQFPDICTTQPELLAHHYTEAGLAEPAVGYWQRAGERDSLRSAYVEAVAHVTKGLEVLHRLSDTPTRVQRELTLLLTLAAALRITKGFAAPEIGQALTRARELCRHVEDTPQLYDTLTGLQTFEVNRGEFQGARELGEQALILAQRLHDPGRLIRAHANLGSDLYWLGELVPARAHLEQALALPGAQPDPALPFSGQDPSILALAYTALTLWRLGYPAQALTRSQAMLRLAQGRSHAFSLVRALSYAASLHQLRREAHATQECAEAALALVTEQAFGQWAATVTFQQGWALVAQGQHVAGMAKMHQGLAARQATGSVNILSEYLACLAAAYGGSGQVEEGRRLLSEALAWVETAGQRHYAAEVYRMQGELLLRQVVPDVPRAEASFQQALSIAGRQQAKSWELRAAMSLARLWQQQGKQADARELLAPIYGWFTEGFDTADLQDAKALLDGLGA